MMFGAQTVPVPKAGIVSPIAVEHGSDDRSPNVVCTA